MIKLPSNIKPYKAAFSGDSAFVQPPASPKDEADDEAQKEYKRQLEEYAHKWKVARETGDYSALRIEGADEPTWFELRQLSADANAYIIGMEQNGTASVECFVLAFRFALRGVTNMGGAEVTLFDHPRLGQIADLSFFDKAGAPSGLTMAIAAELGALVVSRSRYLRPS